MPSDARRVKSYLPGAGSQQLFGKDQYLRPMPRGLFIRARLRTKRAKITSPQTVRSIDQSRSLGKSRPGNSSPVPPKAHLSEILFLDL